ncbi:MAG TPA: hypothetical protein DCS82_01255, partial [Rhodospirillaceae bacterium]|nr:hypothetical protein [Rhodospirillaceae bacterium]
GGPVYKDGRGIGGTGIDGGIGGTGIIGTITGFGSIIVNGARVTYDDSLPVASLDGNATPQQFRLGQVVALETIERNGVLHAKQARIRIPVAGRVANIDTRNNRILVLDRWVQMSPDVLINDDSNPNLPPIIGIGDYVQVSGLTRPDGIIDASRVERRPQGRARIVGLVSDSTAQGFTVGRHRFDWPDGRPIADIAPGRRVVVTGQFRQGRLVPERLRVRPKVPFGGRYRRLLVEGFARKDNNDFRVRGLRVNRRAVQSNRSLRNRRIIVGGVVERGNRLRTTTFRLPNLRDLRRQKQRLDRKQRRLERLQRQQQLTPRQKKRLNRIRDKKEEVEAEREALKERRRDRRKLRKQRQKSREWQRENRRRKKQKRRRQQDF